MQHPGFLPDCMGMNMLAISLWFMDVEAAIGASRARGVRLESHIEEKIQL
jgi:hypothetical protein